MKIAGGSMLFEQDGNSVDGGYELLEVSVKDAGAGKFLIIKTEQWATDIKDLTDILKKVESAFECDEPTVVDKDVE